jgi:hypothetical protein
MIERRRHRADVLHFSGVSRFAPSIAAFAVAVAQRLFYAARWRRRLTPSVFITKRSYPGSLEPLRAMSRKLGMGRDETAAAEIMRRRR